MLMQKSARKQQNLKKHSKREQIKRDLWELLWKEAQKRSCPLNENQAQQLLALDWELNAQGLLSWLERTA